MRRIRHCLAIAIVGLSLCLAACGVPEDPRVDDSRNQGGNESGFSQQMASDSSGKEAESGDTQQLVQMPSPVSGTLEVHFIDVGQADAALFICDGQTLLIDGGNVGDSSLMYAYLQGLGVSHLDYVIGTHAHEDHIGGLAGALSLCSAGTVFIPETGSDSEAYANFIEKAEKAAEAITTPEPGDTIALGQSQVVFYGPQVEDADNLNNTSICCKVQYGETSFLFTGDAEAEVERMLVDDGYDLSATVLKAPHHGSETSSSYVFLREVMPQYVVISVGEGNSYGHPHDDVMSRYRDAGAEVYRTDMQGDVICISDGKTVQFTTEKSGTVITNPTTVDGSGQNADDVGYIGNKNSKKYHSPTCGSLPAEQNRVYFDTAQEAASAGYSPCGNCKPSVLGQENDAPVAPPQIQDDAEDYIGNKNSKKFHLPTCGSLPMEKNRVYFDTRNAAVSAGYDPCGNCRP